jgi:putative two-component system response regulator
LRSGEPATVVVVDNEAIVLDTISTLLKERGFYVIATTDPGEAMSEIRTNSVDAVLTDIVMPQISGIELLENIHAFNPDVPVILMTAHADLDTAVEAIKRGAFDFIIKPYRSVQLINSIKKATDYKRLLQMEKGYKKSLEETVAMRTKELADALTMVSNISREVISRLTAVAEFRDTETGAHIFRIGRYASKIAEVMGMDREFISTLTFASPMHDIGKIGIPDLILLKKGNLSDDEFEVMKTHTSIGSDILSVSSYPDIQMAASIALNHHERFDGGGYPRGLKGRAIPVEGRIVMICDQYDALRSKRPYKSPVSHEEAVRIITRGDGRTMPSHFDPEVLKAFSKASDYFDEIFRGLLDTEQ